ncbi:MAG TPA: BamA/TamA family outer membrane protein, partial [Polyangia bacterium]|nr:BamA/TamA family outer membrane protein [Polyangia bacterium]
VGLDYGIATNRPSFTDDFPSTDPAVREEFARQVFPLSQRVAAVSLGYTIFTPRWLTYRDLNTFDLREDLTLGPSAGVSVGKAAQFLGSDPEYVGLAANGAWTLALGGGLQSVSAGWGARLHSGQISDQTFSGNLYYASPVLRRVLRVVASASATTIVDDQRRRSFSLGGSNGLRGYAIGDFFAPNTDPDKSIAVGHLEVRSMALKVISLRLGGLLFYDLGGVSLGTAPEGGVARRAFESIKTLQLHQDLGFGLRLLIPQFNAYVIRVDWAFATDSTMFTRAGWPGRFSAGFQQIF